MRTTARFAAPLVAALLGLAFAACQPAAPPPEPPAPERVENASLGLAVAALPDAFVVEDNDGPSLRLRADFAEGAGSGLLTIEAGAERATSINLVEEMLARKAWFEGEAPGGRYFGNRELRAPYGPAFTARGELDAEGGRVEETWIYTLHPMANRLVTLIYRYPAGGDSASRVQELMDVLGELEPLAAEAGSEPGPEAGTAPIGG